MPWVKENLDVFLRRRIHPQLVSNFATIKPLLFVLAGRERAELERLGDPQTGVMFGGRELMGEAQRTLSTGDLEHEVVFQKGQIDATENISHRGTTPTASEWAEDQFGSAAFRWADYWQPLRFGQHSVEEAQHSEFGQVRVEGILEKAMMLSFQRMLEKVQDDLWTGTLTSAEQDNRIWDNILGLQHLVSDGESSGETDFDTFGRVDRTTAPNDALQAKVEDASAHADAGDLPDTKFRLELVERARIDFALADKFAGAGDIMMVGRDGFSTLRQEAEARNLRIIQGDSVPDVAIAGYRLPIIEYGPAWIMYDPDCPSGEAYVLTSRSWLLEVANGANFQLEGNIQEKWRTEEGGGHYNWGNIRAKLRLVCREPHLQLKFKNLTTDGS